MWCRGKRRTVHQLQFLRKLVVFCQLTLQHRRPLGKVVQRLGQNCQLGPPLQGERASGGMDSWGHWPGPGPA